MARQIDFFDGAQSSTTPTIGNISASDLVSYPDDATYEATEQGAPAEGNIYYNTTLDKIRYYANGAWHSMVDEDQSATITNKTLDGTDATGTNTITNDATDVSYNNATSGLTATDAQGAIDEVEGRVDANETDIDDLETLSGSPGATDHGTFTGTTIPDSSTTKGALQSLETEVENKIDSSEKGAANGVATLDGTGRIPNAQLPVTAMEFKGSYDASGGGSGSPSLTDGTGDTGDFYRVSVAGTVDHGAGNVTYAVGDAVIYNGTVWEKYDEQTLADTDSLPEGSTNLYYTEARVSANTNVTANTAKVSADGSIDTHSDVDTTSVAPVEGDVLTWNNTDMEWQPSAAAAGNLDNANITENLGLSNSVAANALTLSLKQKDGSTDPGAGTAKVTIPFRDSSITTGGFVKRDVTGSLSIVVPSGATLGHADGTDGYIYLYAIDNAGTVELAVSSVKQSESQLHNTTAIDATSDDWGLYSTVARSGVAIRLIGRFLSNQTTAGTWAATMSEVAIASPHYDFGEYELKTAESSLFRLDTAGYASLEYAQMTGNSVVLTPGTYMLMGELEVQRNGANGTTTFWQASWASVNGDNTSTTPTALSSASGVATLIGDETTRNNESVSIDRHFFVGSLFVEISATTTVYLVGRVQFSAAGDLGMISRIFAKRVS